MTSRGLRAGLFAAAVLSCGALAAHPGPEGPVVVRHPEGVLHGFLTLQNLSGQRLADGDLIQTERNGQVTARLVFHFHDRSILDETAVFSQERRFRLIRDHLVQRGPIFPQDEETTVDVAETTVTVRTRDKKGRETVRTKKLDLPADVSNGLMLTLIKNLDPAAREPTTVSMVATASSPRLVKVVVSRDGEDRFAVGGSPRRAIRYRAHVEIGGLAGVVARLLNKVPPDTFVWILPGTAPAFVKSEGPLYYGGPIWRIELTSPSWPATASQARAH